METANCCKWVRKDCLVAIYWLPDGALVISGMLNDGHSFSRKIGGGNLIVERITSVRLYEEAMVALAQHFAALILKTKAEENARN